MVRLVLALVSLVSFFAFACGGSASESPSGLVSEQPLEGGAEGTGRSWEEVCAITTLSGHSTWEEEAQASACKSADAEGLSIEFRDLILDEKTERTAKVRAIGWVEVCDLRCPMEMEASFDLFVASDGLWKAENPYQHFYESEASKQAKVDFTRDQLNLATAVFPTKTLFLDYLSGDAFELKVEVNENVSKQPYEDLYLSIIARGASGLEKRYFASLWNPERPLYFAQENSDNFGEVGDEEVQIVQYAFVLDSGAELIFGEWKTP
jgi:hypothetical protein